MRPNFLKISLSHKLEYVSIYWNHVLPSTLLDSLAPHFDKEEAKGNVFWQPLKQADNNHSSKISGLCLMKYDQVKCFRI